MIVTLLDRITPAKIFMAGLFLLLTIGFSYLTAEFFLLERWITFLTCIAFNAVLLLLSVIFFPPTHVKEGERAIRNLADYQRITKCYSYESLINFVSDYNQIVEWSEQTKEILEQTAEQMEQAENEKKQTQSDLESLKTKFEQAEKDASEWKAKFEQAEESKKQIEDELATLRTSFEQSEKMANENFEACKQATLALELEKAAISKLETDLKAEQTKLLLLETEKLELALELEKFKAAIKDLKNSDFGKLITEESTNGFSRGYHNKSLEKKLLPQSIIDLFS